MRLFYYFNFERIYDVLKSKSPYILLNKNIKKTKNAIINGKSHTVLERQIFCFSSNKNSKLKVKMWWVGSHTHKKKTTFFVPFILLFSFFIILIFVIFFNICVLSQCILYWIHFQNIHTFTYQKTLLYTLLLLVFKIVESLQP